MEWSDEHANGMDSGLHAKVEANWIQIQYLEKEGIHKTQTAQFDGLASVRAMLTALQSRISKLN